MKISITKSLFIGVLLVLGVVDLVSSLVILLGKTPVENGISTFTESEIQEVYQEAYRQGGKDMLNIMVEIHPDTTVTKIADSLSQVIEEN